MSQNNGGAAFVVAMAGHSGAGKSTIIQKLAGRLGDAVVLGIDDYTALSTYPPAKEWLEHGANPNEFVTTEFARDIRTLKEGRPVTHAESGQEIQPSKFIILEEPFGRSRASMKGLIDLAVYVDVPLEAALARRLSRMTNVPSGQEHLEETITILREHLAWYLRVGRKFYLAVGEAARQEADLIIDGMLSTDECVEIILDALKGDGE